LSTKRQQIVDALQTLLEGVSGFKTVAPWQFLPEEQENLPAVTFEDKDSTATPLAGNWVQHSLTVDIDFAASGSTALTTVRTLAESILTGFAADPLLGDLLTGSRQTGFSMGKNIANTKLAMGRLSLALEYETDRFSL